MVLGLPLLAAVVLMAGRVGGTAPTQVGDHHFAYTCADARLTRFERAD